MKPVLTGKAAPVPKAMLSGDVADGVIYVFNITQFAANLMQSEKLEIGEGPN